MAKKIEEMKNKTKVQIFATNTKVHLNFGSTSKPKSYCGIIGTMTASIDKVTCLDCLELTHNKK